MCTCMPACVCGMRCVSVVHGVVCVCVCVCLRLCVCMCMCVCMCVYVSVSVSLCTATASVYACGCIRNASKPPYCELPINFLFSNRLQVIGIYIQIEDIDSSIFSGQMTIALFGLWSEVIRDISEDKAKSLPERGIFFQYFGVPVQFQTRIMILFRLPQLRGGSRGGLGGQDPLPFGGPPNFIKREKNVARACADAPQFSTCS